MKVNLEADRMRRIVEEKSRLRSSKNVTIFWIAWGEDHVREALASARICRAWNAIANPGARYVVYVMDDWCGVDRSMLSKQRAHGIEVVELSCDVPTNPAMYDVQRFELMAQHDGPSLYLDTDIMVLCPLPFDDMPEGLATFGMGLGRLGFDCNPVHRMIDEWFDKSSSIYYADCGMDRSVFEAAFQVWPWMRINLGMIWSSHPSFANTFVEPFKDNCSMFASTRYFGVGEMVFCSMYNGGLVPNHRFEWRNGWNKIWPFLPRVEDQVGISVTGDIVDGLFPKGRHDVLHVGHFGVQIHLGWSHVQRGVVFFLNDEDEVVLDLKRANRNDDFGMFDRLE